MSLTTHRALEYKLWYHVTLGANANSRVYIIDLVLKLADTASMFFFTI